ncbi:MAG: protoporphyrinogen oxidase [Parachlamydiaceae bacterium]|nr:protoporphyrinogen oxidase [Parachlamydiaceae bacterium]
MTAKNVVILGAGVSGLALAWFLKKYAGDQLRITVFEKQHRSGGWIHTLEKEGFLFEQGPHSFRGSNPNSATLRLIEALGLQDQVIIPNPSQNQRYLLSHNTLVPLPSGLLRALFSPLTRDLWLSALLRDLRASASADADESILDFSVRHFGKKMTARLIDPVTTGIYAGDIHQLSMRSCFPSIFEAAQKNGSVLLGFLKKQALKESESSFVTKMRKEPVFSFKQGMETLVKGLTVALNKDVHYHCSSGALRFSSQGAEVFLAGGRRMQADHLFSTLPAAALADQLADHHTILGALLTSIESTSVAVVNLGYRNRVLHKPGFGYLVAQQEKEDILGVIFDSNLFPQQNLRETETRLTVMLGGVHHPQICGRRDVDIVNTAVQAVGRHLGIEQAPDAVHVYRAHHAIPQYSVGHFTRVTHIEESIRQLSPHLTCLGSSFYGVSINDCIMQAEKCALQYCIDNKILEQ